MNEDLNSKQNTLSKNERICGEKRINVLFTSGESFVSYPLRVVYLVKDEGAIGTEIAMMVSVPKKRFKRAVKRNRIKRLVREAYRLNKTCFVDIEALRGKSIDVAFMYIKNELPTFEEIESAVVKTARLLNEKLTEPEK